MANISNVSFRIDSDLKAQADTLFSQLGMNMTTAFTNIEYGWFAMLQLYKIPF